MSHWIASEIFKAYNFAELIKKFLIFNFLFYNKQITNVKCNRPFQCISYNIIWHFVPHNEPQMHRKT